ncbi:hypothetical protein BUALT_Bualt02G0227400 [Buddleja alternifolia]|uniref:DCD domain-containing protein n=1 Tax=Buddleja alternifolia TaxID=168488 RepID=A0AAV6Y9K7_9LAMI|nr:hypothetical protein BUALT_Bualt02G0227400 [Buddleja alternifolia]
MAPLKNKKKNSIATKSTSKQVDSDKKPLKKGRKNGSAAESTSEQVVSDKKIIEEDKGGDAKESVPAPKVKKPCTWLKLDRLDPQIGSKSSLQNCKQDKEAKSVSQVQAEKDKEVKSISQVKVKQDNKRKRTREGEETGNYDLVRDQKHIGRCRQEKEKEIVNNRHEEREKVDEKSGKNLGGLIFMCNAKTKPDCFKYQVMGIPVNKKEVVMSIKPGLKIFLYDYDLKLMYGIYEASSAGGMKLEPAAFGGGFPAQVRFRVHKDCIPLPESMFKKAIKDSYDKRTHKFKTELTVKQVKHLIDMFRPIPLLHPNGKSIVQERDPIIHPVKPTIFHGEEPYKGQRYLNNYGVSDKRDPLFVTEQEYRNYGLRQERHLRQATPGDNVSNTQAPKLDQELEHLLRNPASTSTDTRVQQREVSQTDPFFLSEKEYRAYGLRAHQKIPNAASPMMTTNEISNVSYDPYDESTDSLVNKYLALPRATSIPVEPYLLAGREPYVNYLNQTSEMQNQTRRIIPDGERAVTSYSLGEQSDFNLRQYSLYASREPSEFNQGFGIQRETSAAPVSQRYSFAGPSPA